MECNYQLSLKFGVINKNLFYRFIYVINFFFIILGAFGYDSNLGTCSILKDKNGRSSKTALFVTAFVIPCLIIIGCYARIFWVVHK